MRKRFVMSTLVVIVTVITLITMMDIGVREVGDVYEVNTALEEKSKGYDGTGYIFDDFNRNINIPLEQKTENGTEKETNKKSSDASDWIYKKKFNIVKALEDQFMFKEDFPGTGPNYSYFNTLKKKEIETSKVIANTIENNMTVEDKVSLLKLAKYIKLEDVNKIKSAISNGATTEEGKALFNLLKERLPDKEYDNLMDIINKYEREVSYKR